ncbi:hypothetical protein ACEOHC_003880 [Salmonella enterica]
MRNERLTWAMSEFQAVQLAISWLESVNLPAIRRRKRNASLALAMVTHDRILTRLRLDVYRE